MNDPGKFFSGSNGKANLRPPRMEAESTGFLSTSIRVRAFMGLFIVLDILIILFFLIPHKDTRTSPRNMVAKDGSKGTPGLPFGKEDPRYDDMAKEALARWLSLQARAEAENVSVWGGDEYKACTEQARRANSLESKGAYREAFYRYQEACSILEALLGRKRQILRSFIQEGREALERQESARAVHIFKKALAIDPGSAEASMGLKRAETLDKVVALYKDGIGKERKGDLQSAHACFENALRIDRYFTPAKTALDRVDKRIRDIRFQEYLTGVFSAIRKKDFKRAHDNLAKASSLRPDDRAVHEASAFLRDQETREAIIGLQKRYMEMARAEKWNKALEICAMARKIDPNAAFFVEKEEEARSRFELDKRIRSVLARPERLQEKGPLNQARDLLRQAISISHQGPELAKNIRALRRLIADATKEIRVTIVSDNHTDVILYKVGKLGRFLKKDIVLHPGTYTVVGRRTGYRDVLVKFRVTPDSKSVIVHIHCEETV